jgi:NAD(P)H-dependent FMN reductase
LVDPLECRLPLLNRMYKEYPKGEAPEVLERLATLYRAVDAFVIVSGEYNHGIPPALKNLLDHFLEEYFWRPSAIVCYSAGAFGGVRAAMQLRMTLAELGMASIPSLFPVPKVQDAFDEEGRAKAPAWERRVQRFLTELEWHARALKEARAAETPY